LEGLRALVIETQIKELTLPKGRHVATTAAVLLCVVELRPATGKSEVMAGDRL